MASEKIEIITGTGRRKNWSAAERVQILAEAFSGRGSVARAARRYGICTSLLYRWRRQSRANGEAGEGKTSGFVPVRIEEPEKAIAMPTANGSSGLVEIALVNGRIVRVSESIAPRTLAGLMAALDRR